MPHRSAAAGSPPVVDDVSGSGEQDPQAARQGADRPPVVGRLRFATSDPLEGLEVLDRVYAVKKIEVAPDAPFSIAQEARSIEKAGVERARISGAPAAALVEAPDTVRIGRVLSGRLAVTEACRTVRGAAPFLFPGRPYTARWGDLDLLTASVEMAALEEHAAGLLGVEQFRLRFTGANPVSAAMARHLVTTVTVFGRDQLGNEEVMAFPLVRAEALRCLATAVLHAFPSTFLDRQAEPVAHRPVPGGVARALAYMEENLAADIGLAQIAEAARMSPRGLQSAFRRELGTTPTAHLRGLRLEAVRTELQATDPAAGLSVEAIAARWGFSHRGRFAAAYRQRFGENPGTTLRA